MGRILRSSQLQNHQKYLRSAILLATGDEIPTVRVVDKGDKVWMLHGPRNPFIRRRQEQYFKVVGEVLDKNGTLQKIILYLKK